MSSMKNAIKIILSSIFLFQFLLANPASAQDTSALKPAIPARKAPTPYKADPSLNGQYEDLLRRSWSNQGYKVINPNRLALLWKNVQDSLHAERRKYAPLQAKINSQAQIIANLKQRASTYQQNLEQSRASVNEVELLGGSVDKSTYNSIMWGAIIILAVALAASLFTAARSVHEARYRRQLFDEISAEYQSHKVKANEKEKKLARELQTERNRVEELLEKNK